MANSLRSKSVGTASRISIQGRQNIHCCLGAIHQIQPVELGCTDDRAFEELALSVGGLRAISAETVGVEMGSLIGDATTLHPDYEL